MIVVDWGLAKLLDQTEEDENPGDVDPSFIASRPVAEVFEQLYEKFGENLERVREWLGARLMAAFFHPGMRKLTKKEVRHLESEAARLSRDLGVVAEKFREKTRARLPGTKNGH